MVDRGCEIDVAGHAPDFRQRFGIVDGAVLDLHHHRYGQGVTEIRMIFVGLDVWVILGKEIRKDGAKFDLG